MNCPFCSKSNSRVIDSRISKEGELIRRRRECDRPLRAGARVAARLRSRCTTRRAGYRQRPRPGARRGRHEGHTEGAVAPGRQRARTQVIDDGVVGRRVAT